MASMLREFYCFSKNTVEIFMYLPAKTDGTLVQCLVEKLAYLNL